MPRSRLFAAAVTLGCLALLAGALPYVPYQIDDAWIVFAYAYQIVDHGEIAWSSGERIEGFSSWLHLGFTTLVAFLHLDVSVAAKGLSVVATLVALAAVLRRRSGPGREVAFLALACWQPLHFWSTQQLETMVASALAAWAWPGVVRGGRSWSIAIALLTVFAITRPEGAAWLGVALAARVLERRPLGRADLFAALAVAGFGGFHVWRTHYFGTFWPAPYLMKVAGVREMAVGVDLAALQLGSAAVILGLLLSMRTRIPMLAWVPLIIQTALLARANGDWMGNARFLMPGIFAAVTTALQAGTPIAEVPAHWSRQPRLLFLLLLPATFLWESDPIGPESARMRSIQVLLRPLAVWTAPWPYPLHNEVERIVRHVPEGGAVEMSDVGSPGHVPGVRVLDASGLVDGAVADQLVNRHPVPTRRLLQRFDPDFGLHCVRYAADLGLDEASDLGPLAALQFRLAPGPHDTRLWRCRTDETVSSDIQLRRWAAMAERFPLQPWLRRTWAHQLAEEPDPVDWTAVEEAAGSWGKADPGYFLFDESMGGYASGRGWGIVTNGALRTALAAPAYWAGLRLVLDVDDAGEDGARAEIRCEGGAAVSLSVHGRQELDLPACEGEGRTRMSVRFLNDDYEAGVRDRNLWVRLVRRESMLP